MNKKFTLFNRLTFFLSLIFLMFIFYSADWSQMVELSNLIQVVPILSSVVIFTLFQITKVIRFTALIESMHLPHFRVLYYVMNKHSFYLAVFPARLGDFYYSSLLKKFTNIPHSVGNISLYVVRIYDVLVLSIFTLIGVIIIIPGIPYSIFVILLFLTILSLILLINLINSLNFLKSVLLKINSTKNYIFINMISSKIESGIEEIQKQHALKTHALILFSTILNWFGTILIFWFILNMLLINLNLVEVAFVVGVINLFSLMPIQTIGGFGVRESGLLSALAIIGFSLQESSTYAILARLIVYLTTLLTVLMIMFIYHVFLNIEPISNKANHNG